MSWIAGTADLLAMGLRTRIEAECPDDDRVVDISGWETLADTKKLLAVTFQLLRNDLAGIGLRQMLSRSLDDRREMAASMILLLLLLRELVNSNVGDDQELSSSGKDKFAAERS